MKTIILFLLSTVFCFSQESQIGQVQRPFKKISYIKCHADKDGSILYFFMNSKKYGVKYLDKNRKLINEQVFENLNLEIPDFTWTQRNNDIVHFYEVSSKNEVYTFKSWDINTSDFSKTKMDIAFDKIEGLKFFGSYPHDDAFIVLGFSEENKSVEVLQLSNGKIVKMASFQIRDIDFDDFFVEKKWIQVDLEEYMDIRSLNASRKIFHDRDKIFLLYDEEKNTSIIELNLENEKVQYLNFQNEKLTKSKNVRFTKTAAVIKEAQLLQVYFNNKIGALNIFDLKEGSILKSFPISKSEDIHFRNSDIEFYNSVASTTNAVKKTAKLFNKVYANRPAISVNEDIDGNYIVELGSLYSASFNYYHNNFWMMHHMYMPNSYYYITPPSFNFGPQPSNNFETYGYYTPPTVKTVTFKTVLSPSFIHLKDQEVKDAKRYNFSRKISSLSKNYDLSTSFRYKDYYHFLRYSDLHKAFLEYEIKRVK